MKHRAIKNWAIALFQLVTYFIIGLPLCWVLRVKQIGWSGPLEKEVGSRAQAYIIASNHPSRLDPFLICYSLPLVVSLDLIPFRFVTLQKYLNAWWKRAILVPFGCVSCMSIKAPQGEKVLDTLSGLLKRKETLFMVPMGGLDHSSGDRGGDREPKVGVVYLEKNDQDVRIIPVRISFSRQLTWMSVLCRKVATIIEYKAPFRHLNFNADLKPLAWDVVKRIHEKS